MKIVCWKQKGKVYLEREDVAERHWARGDCECVSVCVCVRACARTCWQVHHNSQEERQAGQLKAAALRGTTACSLNFRDSNGTISPSA